MIILVPYQGISNSQGNLSSGKELSLAIPLTDRKGKRLNMTEKRPAIPHPTVLSTNSQFQLDVVQQNERSTLLPFAVPH